MKRLFLAVLLASAITATADDQITGSGIRLNGRDTAIPSSSEKGSIWYDRLLHKFMKSENGGAASPLAAGLTSGTTHCDGATVNTIPYVNAAGIVVCNGPGYVAGTGTLSSTVFSTAHWTLANAFAQTFTTTANTGGFFSQLVGSSDGTHGEFDLSSADQNAFAEWLINNSDAGDTALWDMKYSTALWDFAHNGAGVVNGLYLGSEEGPVHIGAGGSAATDEVLTLDATFAAFKTLKTTGAATGKTAVCGDAATGKIYLSTVAGNCLN